MGPPSHTAFLFSIGVFYQQLRIWTYLLWWLQLGQTRTGEEGLLIANRSFCFLSWIKWWSEILKFNQVRYRLLLFGSSLTKEIQNYLQNWGNSQQNGWHVQYCLCKKDQVHYQYWYIYILVSQRTPLLSPKSPMSLICTWRRPTRAR